MPDRQHRVTFQPRGRVVPVLEGTTVSEAAAIAGLGIDTPCRGAGTCGKCRVQVSQGTLEPTDADLLRLEGKISPFKVGVAMLRHVELSVGGGFQ